MLHYTSIEFNVCIVGGGGVHISISIRSDSTKFNIIKSAYSICYIGLFRSKVEGVTFQIELYQYVVQLLD